MRATSTLVCIYWILTCVVLSKNCNVLDYGAVGDGKTLDTLAIQEAINNCTSSANQMDTVLFPSSYNFLTFPITFMYSFTTFQIDGILTAPMDYKHWPLNNNQQYQSLITLGVNTMNNIIINGNGLINGNGNYWWSNFHNQTIKYLRPCLIGRCWGGNNWHNAQISGITLLNSPLYHIAIRSGTDIIIHDINITVADKNGNPGNYSFAPETDGIDVGGSNIHIFNCYIQNGDDSFTLESGSNNVLIENSTCAYGLGLGIPIACGGGNPFTRVTKNSIYRNMIAYKTEFGIRIKACGNNGNQWNGTVYNVTYQNITFDDVKVGIDINVYNQSVDNIFNNVGYSNISNVIFEDIRGTVTEYVGHLDCSDSPPCMDLSFENINLKADGQSVGSWQCSNNVYGTATNVSPPLTCLQNHNNNNNNYP